jgi:peptidoglycan-associated lipoprotein
MKRLAQSASTALLIGTLALASACAKKHIAKNTPVPPAATPAPTISFSASPSTVHPGEPAQLTWNTKNATEINISGIGTVPASGSRSVSPNESTTYSLEAKGPGGSADADARVTVLPAPVANTQASEEDINTLFARSVKDVYFDYDKYVIRDDQSSITQADADFLKQHPNVGIVIEGHCDDRGSEEYNLSLGDSRANAVKAELVKLGVPADRIRTVSYGKEHPFCTQDGESCWSQNRRDHFVAAVSH